MSLRTRRIGTAVAMAALAGAVTLGTAGCGAGQISQSADQVAAINGNDTSLGDLQLRDVQFVFPTNNGQFTNDDPLELAFVIANDSPLNDDKLVSITDDKTHTTAKIEGDTSIPAGKALRAGKPSGMLTPSSSASGSNSTEKRITVTLADPNVTPGLTTDLTFNFAKAGKKVVRVPVDAGISMTRQDKPRGEQKGLQVGGEGH